MSWWSTELSTPVQTAAEIASVGSTQTTRSELDMLDDGPPIYRRAARDSTWAGRRLADDLDAARELIERAVSPDARR